MNTSTEVHSTEHQDLLAQLAASRAEALARATAGALDASALRHVADNEAELALILWPMPTDVAGHTRAANAYARQFLERLPLHDPTRAVAASGAYRYTPRKVLRRVLDHALDHANQLEQWVLWQHNGVVPTPTDGWADSPTTLEEDRLPLTAADLGAWLWRIDLVVEGLAERASRLTSAELDWAAPDGGWTLRRMLHHLAVAEVYYVVWLDAAFSDETIARYAEASQRLSERVSQIATMPASERTALFANDEAGATTLAQVVQEVLVAEHALLGG